MDTSASMYLPAQGWAHSMMEAAAAMPPIAAEDAEPQLDNAVMSDAPNGNINNTGVLWHSKTPVCCGV